MITELDLQRINHLLTRTSMFGKVASLVEKLEASSIVASKEVPDDVVTMNSNVVVFDVASNKRLNLRLVYQISPLYGNQASILSPLGTALLGMKINEEVSYMLRDGTYKTVRVEKITFQPEASKQFEL